MATDAAPAWLTAFTILAPIVASFGVLWITNKQQDRNLKYQHSLSIEKEKISYIISRSEQLYVDVQSWKKYFEMSGVKCASYLQICKTKDDFLESTNKELDQKIDIIRMKFNLKAYFPDLEQSFRDAEALVHKSGLLMTKILLGFDLPLEEKSKVVSDYLKSQKPALEALDNFSNQLTARIGQIMKIAP